MHAMRALATALLLAAPAWSQVTVTPSAPVEHRRITADVTAPEAADNVRVTYEWSWDAGADVEIVDQTSLRIWAAPGSHWLRCRVNAVAPDQTLTHEVYRADYRVKASDEPDPGPDPPTPGTLCELVTPLEAAKLAKIHADQAAVMSRVEGVTGDMFLRAYNSQLELHGLRDHGAYDAVIVRVVASLPMPVETELDEAARQKLSHELGLIADEFEACNPDPEPESGPRLIVMVRESSNPSQETVQLVNALRSELAEQLQEAGHTLTLTDPDSDDAVWSQVRDAVGDSDLPVFVFIDAATDVVLGVGTAASVEDFQALLTENGG